MKRTIVILIALMLGGLLNMAVITIPASACMAAPCLAPQPAGQPLLKPKLAPALGPDLTTTANQTMTVTTGQTTTVTSGQTTTVTTNHTSTTTRGAPLQTPWLSGQEWVELFKAIVWPLTIVLIIGIVLWQWQKIYSLFSLIAGRLSKVSLGTFLAVELIPATNPPERLLSDEIIVELQGATDPGVVTSGLPYLLQILDDKDIQRLDYLIVDLGSSDNKADLEPNDKKYKWLTSRLFLFATILKQAKGLRGIVFLYTQNPGVPGTRETFYGLASVDEVLHTLSYQYPFLAQAYAQALAEAIQSKLNVTAPTTYDRGLENPADSADPIEELLPFIASQFLAHIQYPSTINKDKKKPTPHHHSETPWVELPSASKTVELAHWLTIETLQSDLWKQVVRVDDHYSVKEFRAMTSEQKQKSILQCAGPFVAIVKSNAKLKKAYDRDALVDQIIAQLAEPRDD